MLRSEVDGMKIGDKVRVMTMSILLVCGLAASRAQVVSQNSLKILFLDGRSGKPIARESLLIITGTRANPHQRSGHVATDKDGYGIFPLAAGVEGLSLRVFPEGLSLCYGDPNTRNLDIKEIEVKGLVTPNDCGKKTSAPVPGVLVVFGRPSTWREKMDW